MLRFLAISVGLLLAACSDPAFPPPSDSPPLAPAQSDASYRVCGLREWAIVGNDIDPGNDTFELSITAPAGTDSVDGWLAGGPGFPDNGILVDYVETSEMIEIFDANWNGGVLSAPVNYSIGYHPSNFNEVYKARITKALDHVDPFLASRDNGPVLYGRLSDMAQVWKRPQ